MDFVHLPDSFSVEGSDQSTGNIKVHYDNGETKTITDYGTCGTYSLYAFHHLINGLTETQHWVNADPVSLHNIDSLHTDAEVLGLVRTMGIDYPFLEFEPDTPINIVHDYKRRLKDFGQQRWQKADIDSNGHTDLLFNGYLDMGGESYQHSSILLSFGNDSIQEQEISGANGFFAAKVIHIDNRDYVKISDLDAIKDSLQKKGYHFLERQDTLTVYDARVIEIAPPVLHHIEKISAFLHIGKDSFAVKDGIIDWYHTKPGPFLPYESKFDHEKDSIIHYRLTNPKILEKMLWVASGINFERLTPDLLLPNEIMRLFGSTWYFTYDGGKQTRLEFGSGIGSYRLKALESYLYELKEHPYNWKVISRRKKTTVPRH